MSARLEIATEAWGEVPDWVETLIAACDAPGASQSSVAKSIGRTPGVISQVLRRQYAGNMADIEHRVRSVLAAEQIKCPALDWISSADCLRWRDQAHRLTSASPMRVRMYRACQKCPRCRKDLGHGDT